MKFTYFIYETRSVTKNITEDFEQQFKLYSVLFYVNNSTYK
jgi:hypothetical protein